MTRTHATLVGMYTSLLFACAGTSTDDQDFTPADQVQDPEITMQRAPMAAHVDIKHLTARAPVSPQLLRTVQSKLEQLTHRELAAAMPAAPAPAKLSSRTTSADGALLAFTGMGIADVDRALGGVTGITPPDQGLCAGNGFVFEMANSALQVYDITGGPVGGPVDLAAFFNFPAATSTTTSFASDPKCYFDQASGKFFATILRIPVNSSTGSLLGSALDIAVSDTNDPRGTWTIHEIDLTDNGQNGTPNHAHCPCLGDQPLIGADSHGFYVSTNEFPIDPNSPAFNGAQIYALDKAGLGRAAQPTVVHLANLVLADGIGVSVQPATTPSGNGSEDANGTEYFLSSLDFYGAGDNRIALWALSNTASLATGSPDVKLEHAVLKSETYGMPPAAVQPSGPTPLRDCLAAGNCPAGSGFAGLMATNQIEQLETNDDRMNQVVFAAGNVWGAVNTAVQAGVGTRAGIAMFAVEPRRLANGHLGAHMTRQAYLALPDADMMFPSIAITEEGQGAMAFSLSGDHDYPSAAYIRIKDGKFSQVVRIASGGAAPLDDWAGYTFDASTPQGPSRSGDYSAALIDGSTVWMASEAVTSACTTLDCAGRDVFTNWGTVVSRIDLSDTVDH